MVNAFRNAVVSIYKKIPGRPLLGLFKRIDDCYKRMNFGRKIVVERNGINYELDLGQYIDSMLYYEGQFERDSNLVFERYVKENMVVVDIGANIGVHALKLASLVGRNGIVYAVEPTQWALNKLERNCALNPNINNIKPFRIALSDKTHLAKTYEFKSQWSLDKQEHIESGVIDYMTFDDFISVNNISDIDFIKLDVDGYETKILKGGRDYLKMNRPVILVEMSDYWQKKVGDSLAELTSTLDACGYEYIDAITFKKIEDIRVYLSGLKGKETKNVICV